MGSVGDSVLSVEAGIQGAVRAHGEMRQRIILLKELVDDVVAGGAAEEPGGIHAIYGSLVREAGANLAREERAVFPTIRRLAGRTAVRRCQAGMVKSSVNYAILEHRRVEEALGQMIGMCGRHLSPGGPCETCHALLGALVELDLNVREHHRMEEAELFGRAVEMEKALAAT